MACALVVANLYYAQPLAGPISTSLGLSPAAAGLILTMRQIGYGLGLLLIVPLVGLSFGIGHLGAPGSPLALGSLVAAAILLDYEVTANLMLGQRAIFALGAEYRSRSTACSWPSSSAAAPWARPSAAGPLRARAGGR